jgi:hypothetical protein
MQNTLKGIRDLDNNWPKFLEVWNIVCNYLSIEIKVEEIEIYLNGDDASKIETYIEEMKKWICYKNERKKPIKKFYLKVQNLQKIED